MSLLVCESVSLAYLGQSVESLDGDIFELFVVVVEVICRLVLDIYGVDVDGFVDFTDILLPADDAKRPAAFGALVLD